MTLATPPASPHEQGVLLRHVSWNLYEQLLEEVAGQHVFVTYDRGSVEIMSPSWKHGRYAELSGALVRILATELKVPLIGGGSTTFRLKKAEAGLEPDKCFYVQHAEAIKGKRQIDLAKDPPPDLVIEIEVSRRLSDRLGVYRRLKIPEVSCYDGKRLQILRLKRSGYEPERRSSVFPQLDAKEFHRLLDLSWDLDETAWDGAVREWVRETLRAD